MNSASGKLRELSYDRRQPSPLFSPEQWTFLSGSMNTSIPLGRDPRRSIATDSSGIIYRRYLPGRWAKRALATLHASSTKSILGDGSSKSLASSRNEANIRNTFAGGSGSTAGDVYFEWRRAFASILLVSGMAIALLFLGRILVAVINFIPRQRSSDRKMRRDYCYRRPTLDSVSGSNSIPLSKARLDRTRMGTLPYS